MTTQQTPTKSEPRSGLRPIYVISPSGAISDEARLASAIENLAHAGFAVKLDRSARSQYQRFAGRDEVRASSFGRAAGQ